MSKKGPPINHLAFADDIILFSSGCKVSLKLLIDTLAVYERISGQMINKQKSCVILKPNAQEEEIARIEGITGFKHKNLPIKYLGCPIYAGRKKISIFTEMSERITSRLTGWQNKLLSYGGRAVLIKHVLLALPTHLLAAIHPPKGVLKHLEKLIAKFFWEGNSEKKKYHWASWDKLSRTYDEGGAHFRKLQDICDAFTAKQWWNLRTSQSLWKNFLMAKYCQRIHPLMKKWYSGNSHSWNAMCKIKRKIDRHILWKIGKGDVSFWFDNWSNLGPLYEYLPEGSKPGNYKVRDMVFDDYCELNGWERLLPDEISHAIYNIKIVLKPNVMDKPIWTEDTKGVFKVSFAWNLLRIKHEKSWIDNMTWCRDTPFKRSFIVWRALRDSLPIDERIRKMGINLTSKCVCCKNANQESVDHLVYGGELASGLWNFICGALGVSCKNTTYRQLLINIWRIKGLNPIKSLIYRCIPIFTSWEIRRARCARKYGTEGISLERAVNSIAFNISQTLVSQFHQLKIGWKWVDILSLLSYNFQVKNNIWVRWNMPTNLSVKINSDGSCKNGKCGGGGVVRDSNGKMIFAFTLSLTEGTSSWAEAAALLYGVKWCINNNYQSFFAESDSKMLVDTINKGQALPWRINDEVKELVRLKELTGFNLGHCFREGNQVADKLAELSHYHSYDKMFHNFEDLPRQVRGLLNMDRWGLPSLRTTWKRKAEITYDPP